jgi:uncharacterized protein (UPF0371 family)
MPKLHLAAVTGLTLLCACSRSHTYTTKDASVTIDSKGKDEAVVHITGKDGASLEFNSGKPITDYPSDTPLYQGKTVMDLKSEKEHARHITLQTPDSMDKISDFYKSQLESKGWKIESTMAMAQMNMFVATKEKRKLVISISTDGKMQTVSQQVSDH